MNDAQIIINKLKKLRRKDLIGYTPGKWVYWDGIQEIIDEFEEEQQNPPIIIQVPDHWTSKDIQKLKKEIDSIRRSK